jgi:hypothetical protein
MPQKMSLQIISGNQIPPMMLQTMNGNSLANAPAKRPPSSLKSGIISRIHNTPPGCGGCGR